MADGLLIHVGSPVGGQQGTGAFAALAGFGAVLGDQNSRLRGLCLDSLGGSG